VALCARLLTAAHFKNGWVGEIAVHTGMLRLQLIANVGLANIGPEGFAQNLAPTWLTYSMANDSTKIGALWSGPSLPWEHYGRCAYGHETDE
jgi:hypothetical protein